MPLDIKNIEDHIGSVVHLHILLWCGLGIYILLRMKSIIAAFREILSEKGDNGKLSSRRVTVFLFVFSAIYVWIYSMHANKEIDHFVFISVILLILFGLAIISPEQADTLLDKLKGITTFSKTTTQSSASEAIKIEKKDETKTS